MDDELKRYDSAAGWKPNDPYKKLREQFRKQEAMKPDPADSMLEMRSAGQWITQGRKDRSELFGSLWREGEVAVLFGEKGASKSILAVQLAEAIAAGGNTTGSECAFRKPRSQKVLYLDFQRTKYQFSERYSSPSPIPGKLPIRQRFKFQRAEISWDGYIPAAFKDDLHAYLRHSIFHKIDESGAKVVIIDDISYLAKTIVSNAACIRVMKTLKLWAATKGLSILVIAHMKSRRTKAAPITLEDIAGSRYIAELADSVFAIGRSTFGDEYRYVKHLASPAPITHDASNLLTYRVSSPHVGSPHVSKGSPRPLDTLNQSKALISTNPYSAFRTPQSEGPFLGLTCLGLSAESDHLRDYAKEARLTAELERKLQLQAQRKSRNIYEYILSPEYRRYLER